MYLPSSDVHVPNELLFKVFEFLDLASLGKLEMTSRQFRNYVTAFIKEEPINFQPLSLNQATVWSRKLGILAGRVAAQYQFREELIRDLQNTLASFNIIEAAIKREPHGSNLLVYLNNEIHALSLANPELSLQRRTIKNLYKFIKATIFHEAGTMKNSVNTLLPTSRSCLEDIILSIKTLRVEPQQNIRASQQRRIQNIVRGNFVHNYSPWIFALGIPTCTFVALALLMYVFPYQKHTVSPPANFTNANITSSERYGRRTKNDFIQAGILMAAFALAGSLSCILRRCITNAHRNSTVANREILALLESVHIDEPHEGPIQESTERVKID